VDRISPRTPNNPRFASRQLPEKSVADFVQHTVGTASFHYRARVHVHASADYVKARMPIPIYPEVIDDNSCIVELARMHGTSLRCRWACSMPTFEVLDAPELATAIKELGDRYRAAERFR
jgi:hypothetical protein